MELRRIDTLLLKFLFLIAAGIVVTQVLGLGDITSMLFVLTFPLTVLLWLRTIRKTVTGLDVLMLSAAALAVVSVLLNGAIANADMNFAYMRKLIMFIMSLLFLQTAYKLRIDADVTKFFNRIVDVLTLFLIFMYFWRFAQMHLLNGIVTSYLTFRFTNPNLTGLFLISLYMFELYRLFSPEKWYWKIVHILMAVFLAAFIIQTLSRNCQLVLVFFTALCALLIFRKHENLRMGRVLSAVIAAFPAIFVVGYMTFIPMDWVQYLLSFLGSVGKGLDSRIAIWEDSFEHLFSSPFIGSYYEISDGAGISQMHNTHMDIACSYGIGVLIIVCVLLWHYLYRGGVRYDDKESFIYILSFACSIFLGVGEAALFSGGLGIYIFIGAFLLLAARKTEADESAEQETVSEAETLQ